MGYESPIRFSYIIILLYIMVILLMDPDFTEGEFKSQN